MPSPPTGSIVIRQLGQRGYVTVFEAMKTFTHARDAFTVDECWVVEHPSVFTQGLAGKREHLLNPGRIPVVQADRGGQVTYHGPGQVVMYFLLDVRRAGLGIRQLVTLLEQSVIELLAGYGVHAYARPEAPGVYVADGKVASLGLRVWRGCSYHGLSVNVDMDLEPFRRINPCGYPGLRVTQLTDLGIVCDTDLVTADLLRILLNLFGYTAVQRAEGLPTIKSQETVHA